VGLRGELILSTLFAVEPERRDEYVKGLSDRGVAGLMLKPERFLGTIPQSVLETADRESFPVAEVPIGVLWSRVLAGFYRHLLAEQTELIRVETEMRLRGGFSCAEAPLCPGEQTWREPLYSRVHRLRVRLATSICI
jgi:Purine catabolism regulatory protein-like family